MEKIQMYIDSLTDDQIDEIYVFYDSGGYDNLMRYPSTVVPRLDISMRRKHLVIYLGEFLEKPDPDVPTAVLDGTCSFAKFLYTLQIQAINEPLMHRLNQDTKYPKLGYSKIDIDRLREEKREMISCLNEVHGLLEEILGDDGDTAAAISRTDRMTEKAKELIEEIL